MQKKTDDELNGEAEFKRILIARFSSLGDVAMTIPVIYSVCRANPDTDFCLITRKIASSLFINAPSNFSVIPVNLEDYKGFFGMYRLYRELKEKFNPDAVADLQGSKKSRILSFFGRMDGIKITTIDHGEKGKKALTRPNNKRLFPLISSRTRYREVFHRTGLNFKYEFKSLYGRKSADTAIFSDITPAKQPDETWIGIAPFAKHRGKILPHEKMEKVLDELAARPGYKLFLFGEGEDENAILHQWAEKHSNVISLAEKREGFPKELAIMSCCNAMISMDSANLQLASLVNLPVISVWGITHPYCGYMGFGQKEENAVQLNLTCRPCSVTGEKNCRYKDYFCITGITPEMIITALDSELNNKTDK